MNDSLQDQRKYLAQLLEAIQRCVWFLHHSQDKLSWPVDAQTLTTHRKDPDLFETLSAINERFAKLQDLLASAMRHSALLMGEDTSQFLKVLALFEKLGVIDAIPTWQQVRVVRNMATHEYDLDYAAMAEHFNTLNELAPMLQQTARRLLQIAESDLGVAPASNDFVADFNRLTRP